MVVLDIQEAKFWKCLYILLCSVFPALKLLRYCDANKPSMDKIFFLSHRTTQAIEKSLESLNDKGLFGSLTPDRNLMHGDISLDGADDSDEEEEVALQILMMTVMMTLRVMRKGHLIIRSCNLDEQFSFIGTEGGQRSSTSMQLPGGHCQWSVKYGSMFVSG